MWWCLRLGNANARQFRWDLFAKKPCNPVGGFAVPLFHNVLILSDSCSPLGSANKINKIDRNTSGLSNMSAKSAVEKENKSGLQPRSRPVNQLRGHPGDKAPAFIASRRRGRDASGDLSGRCYDSLARASRRARESARARAPVAYLPLSLFAASLGRASARAIVGGALSHAFQPRCSVRRALSREAGARSTQH